MNTRDLLRRTGRLAGEAKATEELPTVKLVLPDNGRGPVGMRTRHGNVETHLWSAVTGWCTFEGCTEIHGPRVTRVEADRLDDNGLDDVGDEPAEDSENGR